MNDTFGAQFLLLSVRFIAGSVIHHPLPLSPEELSCVRV